jgi:hypothetical protein
MKKSIISGSLALGLPALAAFTPCMTPEAAKAVAEAATLGEGVTAVRVSTGRSFGGWEVLVHMPGQKKGWKCLIDWDTGKVLKKEPIDNPPSKVR